MFFTQEMVPSVRVAQLVVLFAILLQPTAQQRSSINPNVTTNNSAFPPHLYHLPSSTCDPTGIHLAQANNVQPDGSLNVTVSFMLNFRHCGLAIPTIVYGQGLKPLGNITATDPLQFNYTSKKNPGSGLYHSDWIFHVTLPNLKGGQHRYWYRIIVEERVPETSSLQPSQLRGSPRVRVGETPPYTFITPPLAGQPTTLALIGDLGQTEDSTKTMEHIWRATRPNNTIAPHPVTQLLIAGDISYADSLSARWPSWFSKMEPLLRSTLLHVGPGNHEIECDTQTWEVFVPYEHYFRVPNRRPAEMEPIKEQYRKSLWCSGLFDHHYSYGNSFYSYKHGLARVIVLNSFTYSTYKSTQWHFLKNELILANQERDETPWILVAFHAPLYTTFLGHVNEPHATRMRVAMEPLFSLYKVNIIISGHDHAYMRTHPMYNGKVVPNGRAPIYLTLGAGGNREHHAGGFRNKEKEPWVVKRDNSDYGYGHLFLPNATHARLRWVRDGVSDMGVHDSVWLRNAYVPSVAET